MTVLQVIAVAGLIALVVFIAFCFRKGMAVKPDPNRKPEDWPKITQGGSS
jgi:hypothetical protein